MNATSVASSGQMVPPFQPKTFNPSLALDSSAPRPQSHNGGASSFGLGGAGDPGWAKRNKRKPRSNDQSDGENRVPKVKNPFKVHDDNLSDSSRHSKKRAGEAGKRAPDGGGGGKNIKRPRDVDPTRQRHHNGNAVNGVAHHATSTEAAYESRPGLSSSVSSIDGNADGPTTTTTAMAMAKTPADPFAIKVYDRLRKDGISPPPWPSQPGHPKSKAEMAKFREKYEDYRKRARASLTKAGLIDDPEKRKTLQDAIDFRGICDDMCPEYEKITRITEMDVAQPEKFPGSSVANTSRMVKKLARSAAGQEAPLPMDVRSTATLRRTLDYLVNDLLQNDDKLPALHGFLWDRTRAIRRDFTFLSSPTVEDLTTQAYILENIVRFHVTSLHLLSQEGKAPEDFVEQQELEQLGKALLSLRDLYDDCNAQGIKCPNEAEFRAYYLIFHAYDSNTIEMLQRQWKPQLWRESDEIRTAVSLVEALQNTVDFHGPLKQAPSLAASSALLSYFRIVESDSVSYMMACFAECHFPHLRRSILRVVRRAMARPKDATNDVTAGTLNRFLGFDTIQQAIDFAKLHDIDVVPDPQAPLDLGRQVLVLNNKGPLPCPRLQHHFSRNIVEKKRGNLSLPDVIHGAVPALGQVAARSDANGFSADAGRSAQPGAAAGFGFGSAMGISRAAETKSSASSPFATSITQTPTLTGASQASTSPFGNVGGIKSQPPPGIQSNPFATPFTTTTITTSAPSANPFASLSSSNAGSGQNQNSFGGLNSAPADAAVKAFSPSIAAAAGAASTVFQSLRPDDAPKQQLQPTLNSTQAPQNPFASLLKAPLAPSVKAVQDAPATLDSSKSTTPFSFLAGSRPTSSQTDASSSVLGGSSKPSILPAPPPPPPPPAEPAKPTVNSTPFSSLKKDPLSTKPQDARTGAPPSAFAPLLDAKQKASIQPPPSAMFPPAQPQFNSAGNGAPPTPKFGGSVPSTTPPTSPPRAQLSSTVARRPRDLLGDFTKWFVLGDEGLLQEFEVFMVEDMLTKIYTKFREDEEEKERREKEERDEAEATRFRIYNLSVKYFYQWKQKARERRLRKLRESGREQFRAFREAQRAARRKEEEDAALRMAQQQAERRAANHPSEMARVLKKGVRHRATTAEEALLASGVLSGIHNEREAVTRIVRREGSASNASIDGEDSRRSRSGSMASSASVLGGSKTRALREELLGTKPGRFRRSLPSFSPEPSGSRRASVSKVSERWRLKAMGIVPMPDGTALPESMTQEIRQGMMKDRAGSDGSEGAAQKRKRGESDAEKLIRELRCMREEMEEGTSWFKVQNGRLASDSSGHGI